METVAVVLMVLGLIGVGSALVVLVGLRPTSRLGGPPRRAKLDGTRAPVLRGSRHE